MKWFFLPLLPLGALGCDQQPVGVDVSPEFSSTEPDGKYQLVGIGSFIWDFLGTPVEVQVGISAHRHFDGRVTGHFLLVKPKTSDEKRVALTGVTPPTADHPYWCIDGPLPDDPTLTGRVHVVDNDGKTERDLIGEQMTFATEYGTCAEHPDPVGDFWTLESGDFRGKIQTR